MAITNVFSERTFSFLKRIKNYSRSTMSDKRLYELTISSIESDPLEAISSDTVIKDFVEKKMKTAIFLSAWMMYEKFYSIYLK